MKCVLCEYQWLMEKNFQKSETQGNLLLSLRFEEQNEPLALFSSLTGEQQMLSNK